MGVFLGIDIGTSGTKTLAINEKGKILGEANEGYPLLKPKPLWTEQDPEEWWKATVKTVKAVVKKAKLKPADVKAIGLSGQMHGSVFLDKAGKVIRPALLWNDQRTAAECDEIERRAGGREELIRMVANPALTGFTAPKILWLRNKEPKNFDKLDKVLLPKDEIRRRLTGELATEVSDASGMLLLDVANRKWSTELLWKLELPESLLAKCYESEEVTGTLRPEVAKQLGLSEKCMVVGGAGDCAAGGIGTGIVNPGVLSASLGTSGVMFVYSDDVQIDPRGRLHTFCHAVKGKWHMMGVTLCAAGSLDWFREQLVTGEGADEKEVAKAFAQINKEAAKIAAGSEGLFFLPYLAGERTPHADPNARGCYIGLTQKHTRGHLVRSTMEGVAYSLRESLAIIESLGVPVRQIRATGGGAKSPLWLQILASVFGQSVSTINTEQGPALGVALLAAVGAKAFKNVQQACKAVIDTDVEIDVQKEAKTSYDRAFPLYQRLYRSLKDDFREIAKL